MKTTTLDSAEKSGLWAALVLPLASVVLLTLAFPSTWQFYLAWVGLVPWLVSVGKFKRNVAAFFGSWIAGTLFFSANLWWISFVTAPGMIALVLYCGFYWGLIALIIRRARLLERNALIALPCIAAIWTAGDFVRANLWTGFPWIFLGNTQTPILPMCQIADITGAYGVTFWVVMINVFVALVIDTKERKRLLPAAGLLAVLLLLIFGYGLWRMNQSTLTPGPSVLVVQSNYPQSNSGEKGASDAELLRFHVRSTEKAVDAHLAGHVNLAVWSETTMPAINRQAIVPLTQTWPYPYGQDLLYTRQILADLAVTDKIGLLTGGRFWDKFKMEQRDSGPIPVPTDSRNTAYLFQPDGTLGDGIGQRYDKIHLVPFGEFIPFHGTWLYRLFLKLGPNYYSDYEIQDGTDNGLTVFQLQDAAGKAKWRFVTPICFEDLDSRLCAAMVRPGADGKKRADFMVNITNDGWFTANENADHLQAAIFRDIENRVPTARAVNTGISGFIDSVGRTYGLLPARTDGTSVQTLQLDGRLSLYSQWGDLFAWLCLCIAVGIGIIPPAWWPTAKGSKVNG